MHSKSVFPLHCFAKVWQTAVPLGNVLVGLLVNLHAGQTLGGSVAWWCMVVHGCAWWCIAWHGGVVGGMGRLGDNIVGGRCRWSGKTLADRVIAGLGEKQPD